MLVILYKPLCMQLMQEPCAAIDGPKKVTMCVFQILQYVVTIINTVCALLFLTVISVSRIYPQLSTLFH